MRNKKIYFYVILFFSSVIQVFGQRLTFKEAVFLMQQKNIDITIEEKKYESHEYEISLAKANRYPKISAFGQYFHINEDIGKDFNRIKEGIAGFLRLPDASVLGSWDFTIIKKDIATAGVSAFLPIYTGGKINAGIKVAKLKQEIGKEELQSTKNKLVSELADRYFKTKLAEEALNVRKQVLEGMNQHFYNAGKLEEQGIIAPIERLQAEVAAVNAQREYKAAQKDLELARSALANTLEQDKVDQELTSGFFILNSLQELEYYQQQALENYPEIQKLDLQINLTEIGVRAKKADHYPTVFGFGTKVLISNNPLIENNTPWVLGVGVTYTIFDGLKRKHEIRLAETMKQTIELYQEKAEKDIKLLIHKFYQELQKEEEQIRSMEVQIKAMEELRRARIKGFAEGVFTSLDVVDAEINLAVIKLMRAKSYYNYEVYLANLLEYSGLSQNYVQYTQ